MLLTIFTLSFIYIHGFSWIFIFYFGVKIAQIPSQFWSPWVLPVGSCVLWSDHFHGAVWCHCWCCFVSSISFLSGMSSRLILYVFCPSLIGSPFFKGSCVLSLEKVLRSKVWPLLSVLIAMRSLLWGCGWALGPSADRAYLPTSVCADIYKLFGRQHCYQYWLQQEFRQCLQLLSLTTQTVLTLLPSYPSPGGPPAINCHGSGPVHINT